MKLAKRLFTFFLLLLNLVAFAQENPEILKKEFDNGTDGFKEAWKAIKVANEYYERGMEGEYLNALEMFNIAYDYNSYNAQLNYKIGVCYLNSIYKDRALKFLRSAFVLDEKVTSDIKFMLGRAYQYNNEFDKAIVEYKDFMQYLSPTELVKYRLKIKRHIEECENGLVLIKKPVRAFIDNMKTINSEYPDYAPLITTDESVLIFTSRRENTTGGRRDKSDGKFYEDVYISYNINDRWSAPQNIGEPINTKYHDGTVGLSADGSELMLYSNGDIFVSKLKGEKWTELQPLSPQINSAANETHASVSADGNTIYFIRGKTGDPKTSNGDIYYTTRSRSGQWARARKLPSNINTPFEEDGVFIHPDGKTLYFSSMGHNSIGGYDIFMTRKTKSGWEDPVNLGYPINTPNHDIYFVLSANGRTGYYSSNRRDSKGFTDIYKITFLGPEKPIIKNNEDNLIASFSNPISETIIQSSVAIKTIRLTVVKGQITDKNSHEPILATIDLVDNEKNEVISTITSNEKTGKYLVTLPSGKNYGIAVSSENYLMHSENFIIPATQDYQEIKKDIELVNVSAGSKVVLNNIFFDVNKATLRPESFAELERVKLMMLKEYPNMRIEVSGHTDNVGSHSFNQKLSQSRAQSVVKYLIEQGVPEARLEFEGYAFDQPIADNNTEEGRQQNRRVEMKVLSNN